MKGKQKRRTSLNFHNVSHIFLLKQKIKININEEIQFRLSNIRAVWNWWTVWRLLTWPLVLSQGHCCCNIKSSCFVARFEKEWRDLWRMCQQQTQRHIVQVWLMLFLFWYFVFFYPGSHVDGIFPPRCRYLLTKRRFSSLCWSSVWLSSVALSPPPQKISSTNSRCFPSKHENFEERQPGLRGLSLQVWHFSFFEIT